MINLFDMLANAQNGQGMELLARQFNLSQQQAQLAVEALLPAFSQGLKQNASDPYGLGNFLQALSSGQHARYFEDATKAFSPAGMAEGNGILGHLFGSKDLSRAIAAQAAQATGIGQQVLQQMLPAIAAMIMGGLFKQSTNQFAAGNMQAASNPLGDIIEQMMKQGMGGGQQRRAPTPEAANPFDNPFGKILEGMFGGGGAAEQPARRQAPSNPMGDNPLGKIFEEMLGGRQRGGTGRARPSQEPEPAAKPQRNPSGRERNPYDDLFGEMFETGRKGRDDYQKGVESIFEQFTKGMDRFR
ncbi:MAG: DUF937 domain-containing protein [Rhizobiaceae bacterium]|nr:DUF937 domain-containing protein [Rhizobiaceae bacterium]